MVSKKVSVSVSKKFGIEKSIGIGIGKKLVSKKVSDSVSKKIGIGNKFASPVLLYFETKMPPCPRSLVI